MKLYRNIKALRKKRGLSQDELAKIMGYSDKGMISEIEHGKIDLPISKVCKFAEVFRVPVKELL